MKISCIIPVHNAARYLDETLDSIMAQDRPPDEIIAVDDGSTDGSAAVLGRRADQITVVQQAHAGVAAARNAGLRHASGDAIAFQDADDLWPPGRLGALAKVLEENPATDIVAGLVAILDQRETKPQIRENLRTLHRLFSMGSQLIRRGVFDRVGLFNEALEVAEDTEFVMRARLSGVAVARIDIVTLIYRLHAGNISGDVARNQANALDAFSDPVADEAGMRISCIIPLYNAAPYVAAALDSILAQTQPPDEIIVVDDGSTDESRDVVTRYGVAVRLLQQSHAGPGAALNRGITTATSELLAFLDADDLWLPERIARGLAALAADASLDAVFGHITQFHHAAAAAAGADSMPQPGLSRDTLLIRRAAFDRYGLFDETLKTADFVPWYACASARGLRTVMIPEVLARRRLHASNTGILRRHAQQQESLTGLKRALDLRRRQRNLTG